MDAVPVLQHAAGPGPPSTARPDHSLNKAALTRKAATRPSAERALLAGELRSSRDASERRHVLARSWLRERPLT